MASKKKHKTFKNGVSTTTPTGPVAPACNNKNPLVRGGTSQPQRLLNGLKDDYVQVDEREVADWIVFAGEFAKFLKYYDKTNEHKGNWQPFFTSDISATLSVAAVQNISEYQQAIKEKFAILKSDDFSNNDSLLKQTLSSLFSALLTLAKAIDDYSFKFQDDFTYKLTLQNLIKTKFQPALQKLLGYYKGAIALGLIDEVEDANWKIFNTPLLKASGVISAGLSKMWVSGNTSWSDYYNNTIKEDKGIYATLSTEVYQQINHAANHNLFASLFDQFLQSYARLISDSEKSLLETLTNYDKHPAHYALFLAFLRLFRFAKDHINTITHRHLDFYYKEVLRLLPKKAEPNHAHIIIELAKQAEEFLLKAGTLFKAGKDSAGKEVLYALDKDVVINKARVAQLKAVYKASSFDSYVKDGLTINNTNRLFAAPVINSADGLGKEIKNERGEWHPFINKEYVDGKLVNIHIPKASVGFAIASHYLFLTEGQRIVNVKFVTAQGSTAFPSSLAVDCFLTTEKGWYHVESASILNGTTSESASVKMLSFTLPGDAPAITNYVSKVHGGTFTAMVPILKVYLKNEDQSAYSYNSLQNISLSKIELEVKVGLEQTTDWVNPSGIKNLLLSNDNGAIDPAKPFFPFGNSPKKGSSFIIGNEEVLKKKNAQIKFRAQWADMPGSHYDIDYEALPADEGDYAPKATLKYLGQGVWKDLNTALDIFYYWYSKVDIPMSGLTSLAGSANETIVAYNEPYTLFDIKKSKGFLKMSLNDSFNYEKYETDKVQFNIDKAFGRKLTDPGPAPYIPKLTSLTLHYKASVAADLTSVNVTSFTARDVQFYHLQPFGEAEQHKQLNSASSQYLLPQLAQSENNLPAEDSGELYIGLTDLSASQGVNILFQVLEGTTNPLLDKPDEHVKWSYLSNNLWKEFAKEQVTDNTFQLIQSGIISFVMPDDVTANNTLFPTGYVWLKASVKTMSEAVCKFLSVQAQAAVVTFVNNNNADDFLNNPLPASTIAKLKEANALIKKISQPYSSFGGRQKETNNQYYVRVSERLRHKSRAITIWDYEHLVLEQFPGIHKVKCLNHTKFEGNDYNEVAPGHVTIITIPSLPKRNDVNPLRPYTNQDVLAEIEAYLHKKISCHVQLHVRHPQFEEVRLGFDLKLYTGLEFNFYKELLQKEITKFLTPWAYGKTTDIDFGGQVHKSVLINFIEERSYVDYINNVRMYHRKDETSPVESGDLDSIVATTAKSILVSAPAAKHVINEITEAAELLPVEDCVDEWNVNRDLRDLKDY